MQFLYVFYSKKSPQNDFNSQAVCSQEAHVTAYADIGTYRASTVTSSEQS
jgi:hypothetical protein